MPQQLAQKDQGNEMELTKGSGRLERRAGSTAILTGGEGDAELREEVVVGVLQASGRRGSRRGAPVRDSRGSGWPEVHQRREIATADRIHLSYPPVKFWHVQG